MTRVQRAIASNAATTAAAVIATILALMMTAPPAAAANPPIAISDDGVVFGDNIPGQLFDDVTLVPGASATRSFWVKNTGGGDANLAITAVDIDSADPAMLSALTVTAHVRSQSGSAGFDAVDQCASLVHGVPLGRGDDVRVDVSLAMADVEGTTAQGSLAAFNIGVNLTSNEVAAPDGCAAPVPPNPLPSPTPSPTTAPLPSPGPSAIGSGGSGGDSTVVGGVPARPTPPAATASPSPTMSSSATPAPSPEPVEPAEAGNTDRFYQEWFVAAWLIEFAVGGLLAWWMLRRRRIEGVYS